MYLWRRKVLTQKLVSHICRSNRAGDTFSVQCPYHCHLDLVIAPLPPDYPKQYATKSQEKRIRNQFKSLFFKKKLKNQKHLPPPHTPKKQSNLLKHKRKGTDYKRCVFKH